MLKTKQPNVIGERASQRLFELTEFGFGNALGHGAQNLVVRCFYPRSLLIRSLLLLLKGGRNATIKNRYKHGNVAVPLTIFNYFRDEQNESNNCVDDAVVGCV